MTHPDTSLREGVSFSLLFDLRGSCGSLVSEFHELWPWIESKSGHQPFCVMEYIYRIYIYIRKYAYVCNDGTNIEFHNIILPRSSDDHYFVFVFFFRSFSQRLLDLHHLRHTQQLFLLGAKLNCRELRSQVQGFLQWHSIAACRL